MLGNLAIFMLPQFSVVMMNLPHALRCFLGITIVGCSLMASEPAKSLHEVLSPEAFKKAGLEKLSPDELKFLDLQLYGEANPNKEPGIPSAEPRSVQETPPKQSVISTLPSGEAAFGHEEKLAVEVIKIQKVPQEIHSRIAGHFDGWSGQTVFELENGQKWKQTESGSFVINLDAPEVTIKKGFLGVFFLRVAGYGSTVKVKRIQ